MIFRTRISVNILQKRSARKVSRRSLPYLEAPVCSGVGVGMTACTKYGPYACSTGSDALIWVVLIAPFGYWSFLDSVRWKGRVRRDIWIINVVKDRDPRRHSEEHPWRTISSQALCRKSHGPGLSLWPLKGDGDRFLLGALATAVFGVEYIMLAATPQTN